MLPELAAEFFGTLILLLFGNGVVAMVVLFAHNPPIPGEIVNGGFTNINFAFGIGVTMGVYVAGRISGGHINPAVTLAAAVFRKFPWIKVIPYMIAQTAGAFVASAIVYWNYRPQFHLVDPGLEHTAGVFTTFPAFPEMLSAGLLDQTIGTAILVFLIWAIIDERNQPPQANLTPILIGAIVVGIGMAFGGLHGYAINPARDFGPRLFTVVAGFKSNGLTDGPAVFWVPIVGPLVGGLIGAAAWDFGVRRFLPAKA
ncbi:MAG TPA: MIP/aquaporin family protein [Bryobacteraceae bacterium]|nr:MIP/aquaporin family protein [Bryobacteraceae bacterium]